MHQSPNIRCAARPPSILLQDRLGGTPGDATRLPQEIRQQRFENPLEVIRCNRAEDFVAAVARVEAAQAAGRHVVGYISYEAGYLLEPHLEHLLPVDRPVPLLWMAVYETVETTTFSPVRADERAPRPTITGLKAELSEGAYQQRLASLAALIRAGDIYQANFTYQSDFALKGEPLDYFRALTETQPVPYSAYIDTGEEVVLSLSPELFFESDGDQMRARPMKGTAPRGRTLQEDQVIAAALAADPKERAENLMILDLIRNDLSRIATPGSVKVPSRFSVERYRTIHQMVSEVEARLVPGSRFYHMLRALFPCGSVTGAPKIRAMEIIRELERTPRGVYCGAIGHLHPGEGATFNVAIRTLTLKPAGEDHWQGRVGVGGGIVYDSTPEGEWRECQIKLGFLTRAAEEPFALIETLKREGDGTLYLLGEHLSRLEASARYFDYPCDLDAIKTALLTYARDLGPGSWRIRLLLDDRGETSLESSPLEEGTTRPPLRFLIAEERVDTDNPFLFHKTTRREAYERERLELVETGLCDEVLFLNERGEVTEGTIANVFVRRGDTFMTPPISAGLLNGTLRAALLEDPTSGLIEKTLTLEDILSADQIYFGNSVRGLETAELLGERVEANFS